MFTSCLASHPTLLSSHNDALIKRAMRSRMHSEIKLADFLFPTTGMVQSMASAHSTSLSLATIIDMGLAGLFPGVPLFVHLQAYWGFQFFYRLGHTSSFSFFHWGSRG